MPRVALEQVVSVHAQETASLFETRGALLRLPHINLQSLRRLDDRLHAHFDGLAVGSEAARRCLEAELENPSKGSIFAFAVRALEDGRAEALKRCWELTNATPHLAEGLIAAFGWVESRHLKGVVRDLIKSHAAEMRVAGLAACAMHRTDPGLDAGPWLADAEAPLRARALRTVGELGLTSLASSCESSVTDDDPDCRFWGAWSAVLLGNRSGALEALRRIVADATVQHRARAFSLLIQAMNVQSAHALLRDTDTDSKALRWLIQGSGINGDPAYVPWLISHAANPQTARIAGEAFTLITGADLDTLQLWTQAPQDFESGPSESPEDPNVQLDLDEGLMWPNLQKVQDWWLSNNHRFQKGTRYFLGAPVSHEHCIEVLRTGYQRQRVLAAHYLCLLDPGTSLFNTSAPAWRQRRLLAEMS
jgi:uncharacterized protein (TIGR02270 family)